MMLVQCNSDVPISLACSIWIGIIDPHPIKDHTDTPGQGDYGSLAAALAGDLCRPGF